MKSEKGISDDVDKVEWKSSKMINRTLGYQKDDEVEELNGLRRRKRRRDDIMPESVCLLKKYLVRRSSSTSSSGEQKRKIMEEESPVMKKKWCPSFDKTAGEPQPTPTPDKKLSYTQLTPDKQQLTPDKLTFIPSMPTLLLEKEGSIEALKPTEKERNNTTKYNKEVSI